MKILMVLTSHDQLGDTGQKTGFWLEEFAAPYYVLKDAGHTLTLASPKGGQPPIDPKSTAPDAQTEATKRFEADAEAKQQLATSEVLSTIDPSAYDAVFYPGGHGPMWDLANDADSHKIIEQTLAAGKPLAAVCHAPAIFAHTTAPDGNALVKGRKVTGFTNGEEQAVGLTEVVPFLLEDELTRLGASYSKSADFAPYVVTDGMLITGQNPASSGPAAKQLLKVLTPAMAE